jgi:hypothetical protein
MTERIPKDECGHGYISPKRRCQVCDMAFNLVWTESPYGLWQPPLRNGLFAGGSFMLTAFTIGTGGGTLAAIFVALTVFFAVRTVMSLSERFLPLQLRVGPYGPAGPRSPLSLLSHKPFVSYVAGVRFQLDAQVIELLRESDIVLVEFRRWTRLPVAWYRGR